jgi:hypothetical protein
LQDLVLADVHMLPLGSAVGVPSRNAAWSSSWCYQCPRPDTLNPIQRKTHKVFLFCKSTRMLAYRDGRTGQRRPVSAARTPGARTCVVRESYP